MEISLLLICFRHTIRDEFLNQLKHSEFEAFVAIEDLRSGSTLLSLLRLNNLIIYRSEITFTQTVESL